MTLRDYFAAKAMAAYISGAHQDKSICESAAIVDVDYYESVAQISYAQADAMLKARNA